MLCLTALLALRAGTVSFATDAAPVKAVVADLARQSGEALQCGNDLASEPLFADFKDQPIEVVLTKLASVMDADWVQQGSVRMLTRSSARRKAAADAERAKIAAKIDSILAFQAKRLGGSAFDRHEAELAADRYRLVDLNGEASTDDLKHQKETNPLTRFTVRMLGILGGDRLAKMVLGRRVVYADLPTVLQQTLPAGGPAAIRDFTAQIKLVEDAKTKLGNPRKPYVNWGDLPQYGPGSFKVGYRKTLFAIRRTGPIAFSCQLSVVDPAGNRIVAGEGTFPARPVRSAPDLPHRGVALEIDDLTRKFCTLRRYIGYARAMSRNGLTKDQRKITGSMGVSMSEADGQNPAIDLKELLGDPVGRDPMGLVAGKLSRQVCGPKGPLLGTVSDGLVTSLMQFIASDSLKTDDDLAYQMEQRSTAEEERIPFASTAREDGWTIVRPYLPVAARKARMDRVALKELVASIRREGCLTIAAASRYQSTAPRIPTYGTLDWSYICYASPDADQALVGYVFNEALPFLGSLTSTQWAQFGKGPLTVGDLSPAQREIVRGWFFDQQLFHTSVPEDMTDMGLLRGKPLSVEPTELFLSGIPLTTEVSVASQSSDEIFARSATGLTVAMDPESLGLAEAMELKGQKQTTNEWHRQLIDYRLGVRTGYAVEVKVEPSYSVKLPSQEVRPRPGSTFGARDRLPEAILKRVDEAREVFGSD